MGLQALFGIKEHVRQHWVFNTLSDEVLVGIKEYQTPSLDHLLNAQSLVH